jgi:CHAD domain-containing protein
MIKTTRSQPLTASEVRPSHTLGEYASSVIGDQYHQIVKQEKKVLADTDPKHLHHMRVGTRRLRTALQVFGMAVELPKAASAKRIRSLTKVLGKLRDLDVQIAQLQDTYRSRLSAREQSLLNEAAKALQQRRRKAFAKTQATLTRSRYQDLKAAYEEWLDHPCYTSVAQLPLLPLIPDLLSPLLSSVLLHPGWLVQVGDISAENNQVLHDLRKLCKQVRYQAEFFTAFYSEAFQAWIVEVTAIQDSLGKLHDSQVLLELLADELPDHTELPELQAAIQQSESEAMSSWETLRLKYLSPDFRQQLHQMLLEPTATAISNSPNIVANRRDLQEYPLLPPNGDEHKLA